MSSFSVMDGSGAVIIATFGEDAYYTAGQAAPIPVRAIIDENTQIQDPNGGGGQSFQAGPVTGSVLKSDVPECLDGDVIVGEDGRSWTVGGPHEGGMGMWDFTLRPVYP